MSDILSGKGTHTRSPFRDKIEIAFQTAVSPYAADSQAIETIIVPCPATLLGGSAAAFLLPSYPTC